MNLYLDFFTSPPQALHIGSTWHVVSPRRGVLLHRLKAVATEDESFVALAKFTHVDTTTMGPHYEAGARRATRSGLAHSLGKYLHAGRHP